VLFVLAVESQCFITPDCQLNQYPITTKHEIMAQLDIILHMLFKPLVTRVTADRGL